MASTQVAERFPSQLVRAESEYGNGNHMHPRFLKGLSMLYGEGATFRSREQMLMVEAVMDRQHHVLAVLPTGSGKTLASYLPAVLESKGITVHMVPFVALFEDVKANAAKFPAVRFAVFPSKEPLDLDNVDVLLFQLESMIEEDALEMLRLLAAAGRLNRIVIDEAHLAITDSNYRGSLRRLCILSSLNAPIVMLSGTVSPESQDALVAELGLPPPSVRVVRAPCTSPPNVSFDVRHVKRDDLTDSVIHCIESEHVLKLNERGIVWFTNIRDGTEFSKRTGIPFAYGDPECDKKAILDGWEDGQWIAATTCMSHGVDVSNVRYSIAHGSPYNLTQAKQMSGRTGRDGKPSVSLIFFATPNSYDPITPADHEGLLDMREALLRPRQCHRIAYTQKFDGVAYTCFSMPGAVLCSLCHKRLVSHPVRSVRLVLTGCTGRRERNRTSHGPRRSTFPAS